MTARRRWLAPAAAVAVGAVALWLLPSGDGAGRTGAGAGVAPEAGGAAGAARRGRVAGRVGARDGAPVGLPVPVEGRAVDARGGGPVGGVDVVFERRPGGGEESVTTGVDGRFALTLAPGLYEVRAAGQRAVSPTTTLQLAAPVRGLELEVTTLARLRGRVVDAAGAAAAGAEVTLHPGPALAAAFDKDGVAPGSVVADGAGGFELAAPPGVLALSAATDGAYGVALGVEVPPEGRDDVVVTVEAQAHLAGVVVDAAGAPVPGAEVHVYLRTDATNRRYEVAADAAGRFVLNDVWPAGTTLEALAPGHGASAPVKFVPRPGERRDGLVLRLGAARRLTGRVVDAEGAPVAGARVRARQQRGRWLSDTVRTDGDGRFAVDGVSDGPHLLVVQVEGQPRLQRSGVTPGTDVEVVLHGGGRVRGALTEAGGAPVGAAIATVTVTRFVREGETAADLPPPAARASVDGGAFEVDGLVPGTYDLAVAVPGYLPAPAAGVVVTAGGTAALALTLTRRGP